MLEKVAIAVGDQRVFLRINADDNPSIALRYRLSAVPCLILFEDGEVVDRIVGFVAETTIVEMLDRPPSPKAPRGANPPEAAQKNGWPRSATSAELDLDVIFETPKAVPITWSSPIASPRPRVLSAPASIAPPVPVASALPPAGRDVSPRVVGYARASSDAHTMALQIDALRAAGCSVIHEDAAAGAELDRVLTDLSAGDTFVIWRLDRLGRSLKHLVEITKALHDRGVMLRSVSEGLDTSSKTERPLFHNLLQSIADFELAINRQNSIEGIKAAKKQGRHLGRPSALTGKRLTEARKMIEQGKTQAEVARVMGVSRNTIWRAKLSEYKPRPKEAGPVIPGGAEAAKRAFEAKQHRHKTDPFLRCLRGETVEGFNGPMVSRGAFGRKRREPLPRPENEADKTRQRHFWNLLAKEAGLELDPFSDVTERILDAMQALGYEFTTLLSAVNSLPTKPPMVGSNTEEQIEPPACSA